MLTTDEQRRLWKEPTMSYTVNKQTLNILRENEQSPKQTNKTETKKFQLTKLQ